MPYEEASQGHASARTNAPATRDPDAERGVGRAFRHEPDMLPRVPVGVRVQRAGMSAIRASSQGQARREDHGVIGRTGSQTVAVRSGNVDPAAIGINKSNWGIAGDGDATTPAVAAAAVATDTKKMLGGMLPILAIAAVSAFLFMRK